MVAGAPDAGRRGKPLGVAGAAPATAPLQGEGEQQDPNERVAYVFMCQTEITLYEGEARSYAPSAYDDDDQIVDGATFAWWSSNPSVVSVTDNGEVTAVGPGTATVTVSSGTGLPLELTFTVLAGARPEGPLPEEFGCGEGSQRDPNEGGPTQVCVDPPVIPSRAPVDGGPPDDMMSSTAVATYNEVGSPRFGAKEAASRGLKMKSNLGSANYTFVAPVLSVGGRGVGVELALVFNSRLWNKESDGKMTFNYERGWPAPGWQIGYGRIIANYKGNQGTFGKPEGDHLLIKPDGTRVELTNKTTISGWTHEAADGSFIRFGAATPNDPEEAGRYRLRYPDGTRMIFEWKNGRLLPVKIQDRNGGYIEITYMAHDPNCFPLRFGIEKITDTLNREITFTYTTDGSARLRYIEGPKPGAVGLRQRLVELDYADVQLGPGPGQPGSLWTSAITGERNVPSDRKILAIRRIYYPATGTGYLFEDFSRYGMPKRIVARRGMRDGLGQASDGVADLTRTTYSYSDSGPNSDAPEFTARTEWIESNSSAPDISGTWTYSRPNRAAQTAAYTTTVTAPDGAVTETRTDFQGRVDEVSVKDGSAVLRKVEYDYGTNGQVSEVRTTQQGKTAKVQYFYFANYARLQTIKEYGFGGNVVRRTDFTYEDGTAYIDRNMLYLVKSTKVYNADTTALANLVARTEVTYDSYGVGGIPALLDRSPLTTGHGAHFDASFTARGNVTRVKSYVEPSTSNAAIEHDTQYDIYGNVVETEASCCQTIRYAYGVDNPNLKFSVPDSVTRGAVSGTPSLTTKYLYDPNSGLVTQVTSPGEQVTKYAYDAAGRLTEAQLKKSKFAAAGVTRTTKYAGIDGNDLLEVTVETEYFEIENSSDTRTITSRTWVDGVGRPVFSGTLVGGAYEGVATEYDNMGRLAKQTNPFRLGQTQYWTTYFYDDLGRTTEVRLPDAPALLSDKTNTIVYTYESGEAAVSVQDQVGRKRKMTYDALGRLVTVTEDTKAGGANWVTDYTYDALDNLTEVDQGGRERTYAYDGLSRMKSETTPEGGTVNYTHTEFGAVDTMTDARGTVTDYDYDALHRVKAVAYTQGGAQAATSNIAITYWDGATDPGRGNVKQISQGGTVLYYEYDAWGRLKSTTRTFPGLTPTYTTTYDYNTLGQQTMLTYPSGKKVRTGHDANGRVNRLDLVTSLTGSPTYTYASAFQYNAAGLVTNLSLGNGVTETYGYSPERLQLTSQTAAKGATSILSLTYNYNDSNPMGANSGGKFDGNAGQVMSVSGTVNGASAAQTLTYDGVGRLVTVAMPAGIPATDGTDTIGLYDPAAGVFHLKSSNSAGGADLSFNFGPAGAGWLPITGDWDGDGDDSIGLYDPSTGSFFLKNSNSPGAADVEFTFGGGGLRPIAGDWDGDGVDTVGLYNPATGAFFLRNSNDTGGADLTFTFAGPGPTNEPVAGDWDGDGDDSIGVFIPGSGGGGSLWYLNNDNTWGSASLSFSYGMPGAQAVVGDWNADGIDSVGVRNPPNSGYFLRDANTPGPTTVPPFTFGAPGATLTPIAGDWDGDFTAGAAVERRYEYDQWGNRTKVWPNLTGLGTELQNLEINERNQVISYSGSQGSATLFYDGSSPGNVKIEVGNLTNDGTFRYTYDAANRLVSSQVIATGEVTNYGYDATNRRVKKTSAGATTYYVWEGGKVIAEYDQSGTLLVEYVYLGDRMLAAEGGGEVIYYHQDRLSVRATTNETGAILGTQSHLPFGEPLTSAGLTDKHQFTSYDRDLETGTDYAVHRQYNPGFSRFMRPDPVPGSPADPQTLNRYAYAINDPSNLVDPLGLNVPSPKPRTPRPRHPFEPPGSEWDPYTGGDWNWLYSPGFGENGLGGHWFYYGIDFESYSEYGDSAGGSFVDFKGYDPCAKLKDQVGPINFDWNKKRFYEETGWESPADHVYFNHVYRRTARGSTFNIPPGVTRDEANSIIQQAAYHVFLRATGVQLSSGNIAYIYAFAARSVDLWVIGAGGMQEAGTYNGVWKTNVVTFIVDKDCNPVTAFPGLPAGFDRNDPAIFGSKPIFLKVR